MTPKKEMFQPEFSRLISIEGITLDKVREEKIEATEEECAALAERFDVREISGLTARLKIHRVAGGEAIRLEGSFQADLVQECVVSLREVPAHISGSFETFLTEDHPGDKAEIELQIDDDESAPEMIHDGHIDLGEIVAQYLSLEIDPYPRAPGVSLAAQMAESGVETKPNPFQALEKLRKEDK